MAGTLQLPVVSDDSAAIEPKSEIRKVINPRVEIDTSPPFGSVKEAVSRFGGRGSWVPVHIPRLDGHDFEQIDMETVEKQAADLEKELIAKQQETLEVLKQLESTKGVMEILKVNITKEVSISRPVTPVNNKSTDTLTISPLPLPPGVILTELKQAKSMLNRTTNDLAMIRASVESLTNKMRAHKANMVEKVETKRVIEESVDVANGPHGLTFEAQQFMKMEEAAQYEVIKATTEIEHTKTSIKMVEMRLIAAKKMEEAARAMEAVACAENNNGGGGDNKGFGREGITLSYEEYYELAQKARKGEEGLKKSGYYRKGFLKDSVEQVDDMKFSRKTLEEALGPRTDAANGNNNHPKTRNSCAQRGHTPRRYEPLIVDDSNLINKESRPVLRTSVSIGDILSRKLILQDNNNNNNNNNDNIVVREDVETQTRRDDASLSEMLREQSSLIFHDSGRTDKEGRIDKQFVAQRKKFGFIHVSLPLTKHNRKKSNPQPPQGLNIKYP